jgi:AAA+ ATPase superfamily predicted ATPase
MFFDLGPKDRKEEFFGRDDEISEMLRLIRLGNWIVVLGPRMTGKTSIVKVTLTELRGKKNKERYKTLYLNLRGIRSIRGLLESLAEVINSDQDILSRLKKFLTNVNSIHIGPDGLTLGRDASKPTITLLSLFSALDRSGKKYVIALDEVQVLAQLSGQLLALLANVFTSYNNIKFIFTGSQIGLIKALLEPANSNSPMYGRPPAEISLAPFQKETSKAFLIAGLKQCKIDPLSKDRLAEVTSKLDGIAGWLTMFGNFYGVRQLGYEASLERTIKEGGKIALSELENFLKGKSKLNYLAVLKTVKSAGSLGSSWTEIKRGMETQLKNGEVNHKTITSTLDSLIEAEILTEEQGKYNLIDPLLAEAL